MATPNQGLPSPSYPFVDLTTGKINPIWFQFLNSLLQRFGSTGNLGDITTTSVISSGPISGTTGTFTSTMEFGAYAVGTFNQTGYITINDTSGTVRRLMVG